MDTSLAERSADRAREISDDRLINGDRSNIRTYAEHYDDAYQEALRLDSKKLFGWVDDVDQILSRAPADSRNHFYAAHRELVATSIANDSYAEQEGL